MMSILPLLVPSHLDAFEFSLGGGFGFVGELRQFNDPTVEVGEADLERIHRGEFVGQRES